MPRQAVNPFGFEILRHMLWVVVSCAGCTLFPTDETAQRVPIPDEDDAPIQFVGDTARPWGMDFVAVEGVALVTGLNGTGSNPPPSPQRSVLLDEMRTRRVEKSKEILQAPSTSMVLVRGFLPPGIQAGERFDVDVMVPSRSETTSLRDGWLMLTSLRPLAVLGNTIRGGHLTAYSEGAIIDQGALDGSTDQTHQTRGRILGGGKVKRGRDLGLEVRREEHWYRHMKLLSRAINNRFYSYSGGQKVGAAEAKRDTFLKLNLPPQYRGNLTRFMRVVLKVPVRFRDTTRVEYVKQLGVELLDPEASEIAALSLESMGPEAIPQLLAGLESSESAVRLFAAETLAYLQRSDGTSVLLAAAEQNAAMRWRALSALSVLDELAAHDALSSLLHSPSAETRYGAFRALQEMNPLDPTLGREVVREALHLHHIPTNVEPMVHVSRRDRPEVVLFGTKQYLLGAPFVLFAGTDYVIKSDVDGVVEIKQLDPRGEDKSILTKNDLGSIIRGITEVGGGYPEVVQMLQKARKSEVLPSRLVFDAVPRSGRTYSPSSMKLVEDSAELSQLNVSGDEIGAGEDAESLD